MAEPWRLFPPYDDPYESLSDDQDPVAEEEGRRISDCQGELEVEGGKEDGYLDMSLSCCQLTVAEAGPFG